MPREILCLYDSRDLAAGSEFRHNPIWQYAQVVLDHLGWICRYHDLRQPLPPDAALENVRAVLLWTLDERVPRAEALCPWLVRQAEAGRRLVLLIEGAPRDDETGKEETKAFEALLATLGMEYAGERPGRTAPYDVVLKDPPMIGFERAPDPALPLPARFRSVGRQNRVHLRVRPHGASREELDLIVTGPRGGFALPAAALYVDDRIAQSRWQINPFLFFGLATGAEGTPRPDITTLCGRRLYFSHVDGDGFENGVADSGNESCARVFKREFLQRYPLPATVSVIAHELERSPQNAALAREILALENVEPAVHAYAHPLDWRKGTLSYDAIKGYRFDAKAETVGAIDLVARAALPAGRRPELFLWSGDRNPGEDALALLDGAGVDNLNVDDVFFDAAHPSYSFVKPAFHPVGRRMQFNARASSENLYTRLWTRHPWAFRQVLETFRRTGAPVRLCPINLYHHFYVVEMKAARGALHEIYGWVLREPVHAVTAREYVQVLRGFLSARIARAGDDTWLVSGYGACRTVRFDGESRGVDLAASREVIGFKREPGALYVHLSGGPARIVLGAGRPSRPYVEEASGAAELRALEGGTLSLGVRSRGPLAWRIAGVSPGSLWRVAWTAPGGVARAQALQATDEGVIALSLAESGTPEFLLEPR